MTFRGHRRLKNFSQPQTDASDAIPRTYRMRFEVYRLYDLPEIRFDVHPHTRINMVKPLHTTDGTQTGALLKCRGRYIHTRGKIPRHTLRRQDCPAFPKPHIKGYASIETKSTAAFPQFYAGLQRNLKHAKAIVCFCVIFSLFH